MRAMNVDFTPWVGHTLSWSFAEDRERAERMFPFTKGIVLKVEPDPTRECTYKVRLDNGRVLIVSVED